jgi:hypothetical protein
MQARSLSDTHTNVANPTNNNFRLLVPRLPGEQASSGPYNQLVGSLLWAAQCTRPDISFAVNKLSQFLWDSSEAHWKASLRVLNYFVSTKHLCLQLGGDLTCSGYSDSDWAEDCHNRQSTSAYTFWIGDGAISWESRKQATVSLSSTEAEYKAMSDSCKEAVWLRNILSELCLRPKAALPLHVDNEEAEALAKNQEHHTRTKHINARYHFVCHCVKRGRLTILHVSTKDMLADMLTKPLPQVLLESHRSLFGLFYFFFFFSLFQVVSKGGCWSIFVCFLFCQVPFLLFHSSVTACDISVGTYLARGADVEGSPHPSTHICITGLGKPYISLSVHVFFCFLFECAMNILPLTSVSPA